MPAEQGRDPTPQGRTPPAGPRPGAPHPDATPHLADTDAERYEHSAPGPDTRRDGVWFYGRKNKEVGRTKE